MRRARTQAERDAATVEMMYAAVTGVLLAALAFAVVVSPVLAGRAHGAARDSWLTAAAVVAVVAFRGRVIGVLRHHERGTRTGRGAPGREDPR
ncbi:DUF6332 family protein [Streptomyces sp. H10-C2]|uniref:DUF6332 family protein n=1 Tax=unclassified Streptomyces TaxID=2593676 RepID=UPI0024B8BC4F|nr:MULTISPECIES: DUF6332 family protein [unclassified Streptomyces]MDJ0342904.1 DUF6332 family protein [Streptomyces sp. PH10-H1]MDJ0372677.1 DUF6332 family protein [Streptomyces sp. H10-C2]